MDRLAGRARAAAAAGMSDYFLYQAPGSSRLPSEADTDGQYDSLSSEHDATLTSSADVPLPKQFAPFRVPTTPAAADARDDGAAAYHRLVGKASQDHSPLSIAAAELLARGWTPPEHETFTAAELIARGWTPPRQPMPAMPPNEVGLESGRSEKTVQWNEVQYVESPQSVARRREQDEWEQMTMYDKAQARARSVSPTRPPPLQQSPRPVSPGPSTPRSTPRASSPRNTRGSAGAIVSAGGSSTPRIASPRTPRLYSPRPMDSARSYLSDGSAREYSLDFNIFFQNIRIAPTAPKSQELSTKHTLPEEIFFYLHVSSYPCDYPLPKEYPEHKYLHRAAIYSGHEAAGPAIQLQFNPSTVVGLKPHHMGKDGRCPTQLVLVVPVTRTINPFLAPKRLIFQPTTHAQLHPSEHLPRVIVPVMPLGQHVAAHSHGARFTPTLIRNTSKLALKSIIGPWDGTPKSQCMFLALKRWKRVSDAIYAEVIEKDAFTNVKTDISDATVGTPFRFGTWFPRAALDVPPYTTIYFQNGRISVAAPRPKELPTKHLLPKEIAFYVRTMTAEVRFPKDFATEYPAENYLHVAKVLPGHEAGGPVAHMVWNIHTVVGLKRHHCTASGAPPRSMQLMIVVPSTPTINPGIEPTQLAFSPTNFAQLHLSRRLPRIIVPLFPRTSGRGRYVDEVGRYVDTMKSAERLRKLRALLGAWESFANKEVKNAGFKRWVKVAFQLPSSPSGRKVFKPPEPQIGSPYIELLKDKGIETDRARWPRLDRAAHMWGRQSEDEEEAANRLDRLLHPEEAAARARSPSYTPKGRAASPRPVSPGRSSSPARISANLPSIDVMAAQKIQQASWAGRVGRIDSRSNDSGQHQTQPTGSRHQSPHLSPSSRGDLPARRSSSPRRADPMTASDTLSAREDLERGPPWTRERSAAQQRMEQLLLAKAGSDLRVEAGSQPAIERGMTRSSSAPRYMSTPDRVSSEMPSYMGGTLSATTPRTPRESPRRSMSPRP